MIFLMGMNNFSLVHPDCRLFLKVAEAGNISKAAEVLGVGQPGISKAIRRLETQLSCRLFARRNRGVVLTPEGASLADSLKSLLHQWIPPEGIERSIRIGGHAAVLSTVLPKFLAHFHNQLPKQDVQIVLGTSLETTRKVAELELDYGFVINHIKTTDLVAKRLGKDQIAAWGGPSKDPVALIYNPEMIDVKKFLRRFQNLKWLSVADYPLILEMVEAGDYWGLIPSHMAEARGLSRRSPVLREVQLSLIYHRSRKNSQIHKLVLGGFT